MQRVGAPQRHRPGQVLRLRRQPLRPAAARRGRPAGGGAPRRHAVPARPPEPLGRSSTGRAPTRPVAPLNPAGVHADDARAGDVPLAAPPPRRQGDRRPGARHPLRVRRPAAAGHHRRAAGRSGAGWARLRTRLSGICGSDLGALSGRTSLYFSALVSMPFVPGHEVVADLLDDCDDLPAGTRVVIDPVLTCAARGVEPCEACASGATNRCGRITVGDLQPGLQTGFCADTGGGWGEVLTAHRSQLHAGARGLLRRAGGAPRADGLRRAHRAAGRRPAERPGAGQRRRLGRPARDAGAAQPDQRRRDHGRRQARPPAGARARARRDRGGGAGRGAAPAAPGHRRVPGQARARRRRTSSAASTSRSTPSAASSRSRPRSTPPGPAAGWCCPGCRPRPTCRPRGSASSRSSAPTPRRSASPRWTAAAPSTSPPSWSPATRSARWRRPSPLSAAPLAGGARPRPRGRPARHGQGGIRSQEQEVRQR